jgi:hypothetical protein
MSIKYHFEVNNLFDVTPFYGTDPRIRIRTKMSRIRNAGLGTYLLRNRLCIKRRSNS